MTMNNKVFFQTRCRNTVFLFQIDFVKGQGAVSPPMGLGRRLGGGPGDEAPGSSAYLSFKNLLL